MSQIKSPGRFPNSPQKYWKQEYERLVKKGTKKIVVAQDYSHAHLQQLEEKCQKQGETIQRYLEYQKQLEKQLEQEVDSIEIQKYEYLLEQKENQLVSLERDLKNQYTISLEQLRKQDEVLVMLRAKCKSQETEISQNEQLIRHLQLNLQQEQLQNKQLKEQVLQGELQMEMLEMQFKQSSREQQLMQQELREKLEQLNINVVEKREQLNKQEMELVKLFELKKPDGFQNILDGIRVILKTKTDSEQVLRQEITKLRVEISDYISKIQTLNSKMELLIDENNELQEQVDDQSSEEECEPSDYLYQYYQSLKQ